MLVAVNRCHNNYRNVYSEAKGFGEQNFKLSLGDFCRWLQIKFV